MTKNPRPIRRSFQPHHPGVDYGVLDELLGYEVRRAQIRVTEAFDARLGALGVTTQRFSALVLIAANPGLKQTELAAIMGIARSGALAIVEGLGDLVARQPIPGDARAQALALSAAGQARLPAIIAEVRAHDREAAGDLTPDEIATLKALLARVAP
ncbi:MarR family winged helix-turn-helix transcriptional regulator [Phenylobacterium aquaticum]|uniref:MarR family winged helix-turn-helix transcriptional regulator n=1 Tax=Phenylobacterium aquaticum TaxID=1763816 RepID=UPI0026E9E11A|nr:MarR family winged helix-turn-helix transcriptional regulator [Phenylobacterium aquaticum]